jgi:hypothetical protein
MGGVGEGTVGCFFQFSQGPLNGDSADKNEYQKGLCQFFSAFELFKKLTKLLNIVWVRGPIDNDISPLPF